jgi:hypothetical protein
MRHIEDAQFWQARAEWDTSGVDGSRWLIEGRREGGYHAVDRYVPQSTDPRFAAAGRRFLQLAGLEDQTGELD